MYVEDLLGGQVRDGRISLKNFAKHQGSKNTAQLGLSSGLGSCDCY